ncbi:hypothetical protein D9M72_388600 [compost metagenome]
MLRRQGADTNRQLVGVVLVLAGFLANPVEALAQAVALGKQLFALLGIAGHGVEGVLQGQAGLAQLLVLQSALLVQLAQFFLQAAAAQSQLFHLRLLGGQARLELAQGTGLVLQQATLLLTGFFLLALVVAQPLQAFFQMLQRGFAFFALGVQALQFLATGQQTAFRLAGTAYPEEIAPYPVAIPADQAFAFAQAAAAGQGLVQAFHRLDPGQPGRQVHRRLDLVQQAARHPRRALAGTGQAQLALAETGQVEAVEIIQQHGLQVGTEHGFHCQLPALLHPQAFGQPGALGEIVLLQPFGGALAGVQRGLLQCFQRGDAPIQALQFALSLLLGLAGLLQLFT